MEHDQASLRIDGDDRTVVDATWSRTGKRVILTTADPHHRDQRQAVLTVDQAAELGRFLAAGPGEA